MNNMESIIVVRHPERSCRECRCCPDPEKATVEVELGTTTASGASVTSVGLCRNCAFLLLAELGGFLTP